MDTVTTEDVKRLVSVLTDDERRLLKDAVRHEAFDKRSGGQAHE